MTHGPRNSIPAFSLANFRSSRALTIFLLATAIGLGLDLWSKYAAFHHLAHSPGYEFIPGWLHFTTLTNEGAVFGLAEGRRILFLTVSVAAIAFLLYLFATSGRQWFYQIILGMLLAGVLGNMYDRLRYGHVRDMIHALPQWPKLFPWVFNVADVLLCTGVALMVLYSLLQKDRRDGEGSDRPQVQPLPEQS
jgi:lipoprotein signal peptidase